MTIKKVFTAILLFSFIVISCQESIKSQPDKEREPDEIKSPNAAKIYVTFNSNGGVWPDGTEIIALSSKSDKSPNFPTDNPLFEGYIFIGWALEKQAPFPINVTLPDFDKRLNSDSKIIAPITVYAIWAESPPNSNTVIFITSLENEIPEKIHDVRYAYEYNGYRLLSALPSTGTKKHYSGNGKWYLSHVGHQEFTPHTEIETPEFKVYARWYPNIYIVSFYADSTAQPVYRSYSYAGQDILFPAADFPPAPTPPASDSLNGSYTFVGWFFNENVVVNPMGLVPTGQNLSSGYSIEKNISAYAGWRRSNNVITFQTYNENGITPVHRAVTANGSSYKLTGTVPDVGNRQSYISDDQWYLDENAGAVFNAENIPAAFLAGSAEVHGNWLNQWMGKKIEFYHWYSGPKVTTRLAKLNQTSGEGYALLGGIPAVPPRSGYTGNGKWYYWRYAWGGQSGYEGSQIEFNQDTNIEGNMTVFGKWTENAPPPPPPPPPPPVQNTPSNFICKRVFSF